MQSAVHILQLATWDGLKRRHDGNLIGMVKNIATCTHNPKIKAFLKRRAKEGAIINYETRWGTTYVKIQCFLELKSI